MVNFPNGATGILAAPLAAVELKQGLECATILLLLAVAKIVRVLSMSCEIAVLKIVVRIPEVILVVSLENSFRLTNTLSHKSRTKAATFT